MTIFFILLFFNKVISNETASSTSLLDETFAGNLEDCFNPADEAHLMFAMEDEDDFLLQDIDLSDTKDRQSSLSSTCKL